MSKQRSNGPWPGPGLAWRAARAYKSVSISFKKIRRRDHGLVTEDSARMSQPTCPPRSRGGPISQTEMIIPLLSFLISILVHSVNKRPCARGISNTKQMEEPHESHVLILPFPAHGHIKPMLCLAKLLTAADLRVTFLNTHHNHRRILPRSPSSLLRFESISDGLPDDHPRSLELIDELLLSIKTAMKAHLREFLLSESAEPPVTCIIADGIMSIGIDVAEELSIPAISFRTFSACCLWTNFCIPTFIHEGKLPFSDDDLDKEFHGLPGAEGLLRRRDLPIWKVGLDMKDTCDRSTVETMVRILMEDNKEEIMRSMTRISGLSLDSVGPDGSSSKNLERLIENIRMIGRTS
ncbi:hypothetical protein NL676_018485 [Syzygium grande]|nr:hypothetical protein NL676_018485 [Syzygium grande]